MTATSRIEDREAAAPVAARRRSLTSLYMELAKARLSGLVVLTTVVGYLLAIPGAEAPASLALTLLGTALAAGGSGALNQWAERRLDARMERTRSRPLPSGELGATHALVWGIAASLAGITLLAAAVNPLTAGLAAAVVVLYMLVYTPLKRRNPACTLVGAVCGAIPPMMGWAAARGDLGLGAWILGAILFVWQIPHFLALAWLYREDYERGGFRMLPLVDLSGQVTALMVVLYTLALLPLGLAVSLAGLSGWVSAAGSLILGAGFLVLGLRLQASLNDVNARRVFLASLLYLPLVLGLMVADRAAPAIADRAAVDTVAGPAGQITASSTGRTPSPPTPGP